MRLGRLVLLRFMSSAWAFIDASEALHQKSMAAAMRQLR